MLCMFVSDLYITNLHLRHFQGRPVCLDRIWYLALVVLFALKSQILQWYIPSPSLDIFIFSSKMIFSAEWMDLSGKGFLLIPLLLFSPFALFLILSWIFWSYLLRLSLSHRISPLTCSSFFECRSSCLLVTGWFEAWSQNLHFQDKCLCCDNKWYFKWVLFARILSHWLHLNLPSSFFKIVANPISCSISSNVEFALDLLMSFLDEI